MAQDDRTVTQETWRQISPRTFEGSGEVLRKATGERLNTETLRLVEMSGEIFYLAKVGHNTLPIAFKVIRCGEEAVVFENPAHDFPKRLDYRRGGIDSLVVGVSDGGSNGFTLRFGRKQGR